jgi:hypothetical protein
MTGLVWRIATRQVMPGRTCAENPEHAVEHGAGVGPRATPFVGPASRSEDRFEHGPLGVGEVHAVEYDGDRNFVHPRPVGFMR